MIWRVFQIAIVLLVSWAWQTYGGKSGHNTLAGGVLGIIAAGFATLIVSAAIERAKRWRRFRP